MAIQIFKGSNYFRQRLVMALLAQKPISIIDIRTDEDEDYIGLTDYESAFLRLLEKITTESTIEINHTGTAVTFYPGSILGGTVEHECPKSRAIGYYLEALIALAPFSKNNFDVTLTGITNDNVDPSVDIIRTAVLPQFTRFGIEGLELKIIKRGAPPLGGGMIQFTCPAVRKLNPVQFTEIGKIKRIRGIAYVTRMAPQMANRMVDSCRKVLTRYIPDVYIYTDCYKGAESGLSPGYALSLVAETQEGALISTECAYQPRKENLNDDGQPMVEDMLVCDYMFPTPEDLGVRVARQLLVEIKKSGSVDSISQWINLLFITMGPENVGKIRVGTLTPFTAQYLRDLKTIFGITFKIEADKESRTILLSTMGIGYSNANKKVT